MIDLFLYVTNIREEDSRNISFSVVPCDVTDTHFQISVIINVELAFHFDLPNNSTYSHMNFGK